jgi:hypothetical protein
MEFVKNRTLLYDMKNSHFFLIGLTASVSFGFGGIIDSIPRANWKFYAIVMPAEFKYHIKRTMMFLTAVFGLLLIIYILSASFFGITLLITYLFCLMVLLLIAVTIGFTTGGMFMKAIGLIGAILFTLWVSTLPVYFLALPLFLALITMLKAKNEYRERYYI